MENGDYSKPRQRAVIYASSSRWRRLDANADGASSSALSSPNWFDLSLVLPEFNPIGARLQRGLEKMGFDPERTTQSEDSMQRRMGSLASYRVPKISHLSPTKDMMRQKASNAGRVDEMRIDRSSGAQTRMVEVQKYAKQQQQHFHRKSHFLLKKRRTTHAGAPVVLDRIDRESRLNEKLRKDMSKFGLWCMADEMLDDGWNPLYENAPPYGSISDVAVICGKKVDGISLVVKTNAAVSHEGALHGNPFGNRDVFALSRGEVLISIEGFASQTVYGLRFGTSSGRLSKWYGHCDKGTKFEICSEYAGKREEIVGLFGYADGTSLHAVGAVFRHTTFKNIFEGLWLQTEQPGGGAQRNGNGGSDEVSLCDRQFSYFLQVRMIDVLSAMKRAHRFALRAHRATHVPSPLTRIRIIMGITRWFFNSLAHGLVHNTSREEEGKRILQDGVNKRASGEKSLQEGLHAMELVDSSRDDERQLNVATLGAKKVNELREMMEQGQQRIALGRKLIDEAQAEILAGRRILPHLPTTKRMLAAIRKMYRVVQTKDYIDQMDPDVRAILLVGDRSSQDFAMSDANVD